MSHAGDALRRRAAELRRLATRIDRSEVMVMDVAPSRSTWLGPAQTDTHRRMCHLVAQLGDQVAQLRHRARRLEIEADECDRQALLAAQDDLTSDLPPTTPDNTTSERGAAHRAW